MKKCKKIIFCIEILHHICGMIIFGFVIALCTLSSKDPFKSHIIGDMTDYFNNYPNEKTQIESICNCNNVTYEYNCSKENMLEGCLNNSSDVIDLKPFLKRKLSSSSFCKDIQESFARNKGRKLKYIFDLRYQAIRKISIALLIVDLSSILFFGYPILNCVIISCYTKHQIETNEKILICYSIISITISILLVIGWIGKYVLLILLYYFLENGDIGKYDDFLDCKNVKEEFFKKFDDINKLRKCFIALAILNIISESLDKVKEFLENYRKYKKEFKKQIINQNNINKNIDINNYNSTTSIK